VALAAVVAFTCSLGPGRAGHLAPIAATALMCRVTLGRQSPYYGGCGCSSHPQRAGESQRYVTQTDHHPRAPVRCPRSSAGMQTYETPQAHYIEPFARWLAMVLDKLPMRAKRSTTLTRI